MATPTPPTQTKDSITCHVLDTTTGKPARGVRVKLELVPQQQQQQKQAQAGAVGGGGGHHQHTAGAVAAAALAGVGAGVTKVFESQTDDDGRVKAWLPYSSATSSGEVPVYTLEDVLASDVGEAASSRWTLRFDAAAYFGGEDKTFFPEVVVTFTVLRGQHYHVPLLLAPYSYTTYRGS